MFMDQAWSRCDASLETCLDGSNIKFEGIHGLKQCRPGVIFSVYRTLEDLRGFRATRDVPHCN